METILVHTSKEYAVKVGPGLLHTIGTEVAAHVQGRTVAIVSDNNVWPIYGKAVLSSLENAGFSPVFFTFSPGEASKNGTTYLQLLTFLAQHQLTHSDCLIALGGGVVGDLAGFTAATYLRGIPYIQVPTSLLAMVDSSVGGKTAIDLPIGKNLVGAFYQPTLVLCDTNTLLTLPTAVFTDGCAEIIKYGVLFDECLFSHLEEKGTAFHREETIAHCIKWKRDVVEKDEFDLGSRQQLNFGHTIGHAIEKASNYTLSHGNAVAIGMCVIAKASAAKGICTAELSRRLQTLVQKFDLPCATHFSINQLLPAILSDKKRAGDAITLVLPATIGCARLRSVPTTELKSFIEAGM